MTYGLRVVGLLLVHLCLLHALFKLLLGLFVLFFGLLFGLLHLLQGQLFLLLSLVVAVIGGQAASAGKGRWRLGNCRPTEPLAGAGKSTAMFVRRTDPDSSMVSVVSGRAASNSASIAIAAAPAKSSAFFVIADAACRLHGFHGTGGVRI